MYKEILRKKVFCLGEYNWLTECDNLKNVDSYTKVAKTKWRNTLIGTTLVLGTIRAQQTFRKSGVRKDIVAMMWRNKRWFKIKWSTSWDDEIWTLKKN